MFAIKDFKKVNLLKTKTLTRKRGMIQMKALKKLNDKIRGLTDAISRFPLTTIFLLMAVLVNSYDINTEKDYLRIL